MLRVVGMTQQHSPAHRHKIALSAGTRQQQRWSSRSRLRVPPCGTHLGLLLAILVLPLLVVAHGDVLLRPGWPGVASGADPNVSFSSCAPSAACIHSRRINTEVFAPLEPHGLYIVWPSLSLKADRQL